MKTRSVDDIRRMALERGVEAEIDGSPFNTGLAQRRAVRMPPAPPPAPEPDHLADALMAGTESTAQLARAIAALAIEVRSQKQAAPSPIIKWEFEVERDDDGQLTRIFATATQRS